jgi:hypothetical protein
MHAEASYGPTPSVADAENWLTLGTGALLLIVEPCATRQYTRGIPGVYGGWLDKFPVGAAFAKGLTLEMGQAHMHKYIPILLERIERVEIDPSFIITHRIGLEDAPSMYRTFGDKHDSCIKVVMKPGVPATTAHHQLSQA